MSNPVPLEASEVLVLPSGVTVKVWHPLPDKKVYFPFVDQPGLPTPPPHSNITVPKPALPKLAAQNATVETPSVAVTNHDLWITAGGGAVGILVLLVGLWLWGNRHG